MRLVLEGGGVRAAYAAGLLLELQRASVPVDAVIGSSSGAINAAFFAARQMETAVKLWTEHAPSERFISYRRQFTPWGAPGLGVDDMLDNMIAANGLMDLERATCGDPALFLTVTEVETSSMRLVRPKADTLIEWLRAALALPVGYNRVVQIDGKGYIDGGVSCPACFEEPLDVEINGPTVVVLTRPMQTAKPPPVFWERLAVRLIVPKAVRELTLNQHTLHNRVMAKLRSAVDAGEVILVDPPPGMPISRLTRDPSKVKRGVELGRQRAEALLKQLAQA